jgi:hypothetical protein
MHALRLETEHTGPPPKSHLRAYGNHQFLDQTLPSPPSPFRTRYSSFSDIVIALYVFSPFRSSIGALGPSAPTMPNRTGRP